MYEAFAELAARISQLEHRLANLIVPGRVTDVDADAKRVRMEIGTPDAPCKSPWVRYGQIAGKLKVHTLPTVGQQMTLFNASGDLEQGLAMPLGWSNDNAAPGDDDKPVVTFGSVRVEIEDEAVVVDIGDFSLRAAADGLTVSIGGKVFTVKADEIRTSGKTVLNDGTREVVFKGSTDSHGDTNNQGAGGGVLV